MAKKKHPLFGQLKKPDAVLCDGDFAVVHAWDRWHLLTVHILNDNAKGIFTLHFMSREEVDDFFAEQNPGAAVQTFDEVSKDFAADVAAKLLEKAEDYMPLLESGHMDFGYGMTSDDLHHIQYDPKVRQQWLDSINEMMTEGGPGPYLRFQASHRQIRPA